MARTLRWKRIITAREEMDRKDGDRPEVEPAKPTGRSGPWPPHRCVPFAWSSPTTCTGRA